MRLIEKKVEAHETRIQDHDRKFQDLESAVTLLQSRPAAPGTGNAAAGGQSDTLTRAAHRSGWNSTWLFESATSRKETRGVYDATRQHFPTPCLVTCGTVAHAAHRLHHRWRLRRSGETPSLLGGLQWLFASGTSLQTMMN